MLREATSHDRIQASVMEAWNSYLSPEAFKNVHRRLRVVLTCIVDDAGGNSLVETKRGKLFRDATIIDLTEEDNAGSNENQPDHFFVADLDEFDDTSDD